MRARVGVVGGCKAKAVGFGVRGTVKKKMKTPERFIGKK